MINIIQDLKRFKILDNIRINIISFLLILIVFSLDRLSKIKILQLLENKRLYINDFINFDLVWNSGIGFGFFSSQPVLIYNLITLLISVVIIILIFLMLKSKVIDKIMFALIAGGALGNVYDRIIYAAVPDFIDIHYNTFHWFTFNIADIFISIGIVVIISKDLLFKND